MIFLTNVGDEVDIDPAPEADRSLFDRLAAGSEAELRGFIARTLRDVGVPSDKATRVMRTCRTQYFEDLARPFPGINDAPKRNRSRRERPGGRV